MFKGPLMEKIKKNRNNFGERTGEVDRKGT